MSRRKSSEPTGVVFLNSAQAVELLHKNPCRYDEVVLGGLLGGLNTYAYVEGNPVSYVDPTGEIVFLPVAIGIGIGLGLDYAVEKYKQSCGCKSTGSAAGADGNAALGGAQGAAGNFADKPRTGIGGGGPSGSKTSTLSQLNHAAS